MRDSIRIKKPKWLMLENVKNMVSATFLPTFQLWLTELSNMGYDNFTKILNSKDYGVPQNRERIFVVSIRSDLGSAPQYYFPKPFELRRSIKDIIEPKVAEKYYLSAEKTVEIIEELQRRTTGDFPLRGGSLGVSDNITRHKFELHEKTADQIIRQDYAPCLRATDYMGPLYAYHIAATRGQKHDAPADGETIGISKNLTSHKLELEGKTVEQIIDTDCCGCLAATDYKGPKYVYHIAAMRGRNPDNPSDRKTKSNGKFKQRIEVNSNGLSNTLTSVQKDNLLIEGIGNVKVRKLTPREYFRFMGVKDEKFDLLVAAGLSDSSLYKLAGNSIVVDVLFHLFRKAFVEPQCEEAQMSIF